MTKTDNKALFSAIQANDQATVARLLDKYPTEIDVYGLSDRFCRDKTPLMFSMQCGHFDLAAWLVGRGADVTKRMNGGPKRSVLALAVEFGNPMSPHFKKCLEFVPELIGRGADPTEGLSTAVFFYRNWGNAPESMIRLLLEAGANPDVQNGEMTLRERVANAGERLPPEVRRLFGIQADDKAV